MSDLRPTSDSMESGAPISDEIGSGVHAHHIKHATTENETIIDFSVLLPRFYMASEQDKPGEIRPRHDVVGRIVVPTQAFVDFIKSVVGANPELYTDSEPERSGTEPTSRNDAALAAIRSFRVGNAAEQKELLSQLERDLDRERPEGQKLFPRH